MAVFVSDSFTDTDATQLEAHTGETGATWTRAQGTYPATITSNRFKPNGSTYRASGVQPGADYKVGSDFYAAAALGSNDQGAICARVSSSGKDFVCVRYESPYFVLREVVNLTATSRGTYSDSGMSVSGATRAVVLSVSGSVARVYIDGVLRIVGSLATVTGSNPAGLWGGKSNANLHLDNFTADDMAVSADFDTSATITNITATIFDTSVAITAPVSATFDTRAAITAPVIADFDTAVIVSFWTFYLGSAFVGFVFAPLRPYAVARSIPQPTGRDSAGNLYAYTKGARVTAIHRLRLPRLDAATVASLLAFHRTTTRGTGLTFTWADIDGAERTVRFADKVLTFTPTGPGRWICDITLEEMV